MKKLQSAAYKAGITNGKAAEVRSRYHQEEEAKALPRPPLPKRYYRMPVEGYTTSDGVKVEGHTVTVEVVQP
ncbi:hypothetical protein JIN85_18520 [Luteolibacter pohnpeiensis]|uniref:Uncharacterized protein n=1 Tax=Luteolibacter pohnpeiensis TaxID=454153 RepID=A0A934SFV5_9BACT|nr:hypothetical protein [Luteolibacter pohnpeiensis]MBK1884418.1 hypothetical protein [Luteolibacter pohnpeiensis]